MVFEEIAQLRLISQQIKATRFQNPVDLVGWMGAMQAQDYAMAKWAVGLRLLNSTQAIVESAISSGRIIRTHVMRPTWHFIVASDVYWMLEFTAPQIRASMRSRNRQLGLDSEVLKKNRKLLENAFKNGMYLTRPELLQKYVAAGIRTDENRLSHLLLEGELDALLCNGPEKNGRLTYSFLPDHISKPVSITRDESLEKLAHRYFVSHGPATLKDFTWWSGLSPVEVRKVPEMLRAGFESVTIGNEKFWYPVELSAKVKPVKSTLFLLPAYDEFLISYRDRSAALSQAGSYRVASVNGIFYPVILMNGQVTGIWKRITKGKKIVITLSAFIPYNEKLLTGIEKKIKEYSCFLEKDIEINRM